MFLKSRINVTLFLAMLSLTSFISMPIKAINNDIQRTLTPGENIMPRAKTQQLIENFYKYFNRSEIDKVSQLISNDIAYEINHNGIISGKDAFIAYVTNSKLKHYDERVDNYILMISEDGHHAATKLIVKGKYIATDASSIPAKGQNYILTALNYFEIENDKIVKASCWYDDNDWIRQVS